MGKIIAIANQKGGVGKTTTSINLSAGLAYYGKKVLIIDMDPQANATQGLGQRKDIKYSTYNLLIDSEITANDCLIKTNIPRLDIIPSTIGLSGFDLKVANYDEGREQLLRKKLIPIKQNYDFIIIDCPPSLGLLNTNSLTAADSVLIPVQCEYYALEGLTQLLQTIKLVQQLYNSSLYIEGVLLTMYDTRTNLAVEVASEVRKFFKESVYKVPIPRNVSLSEAPSYGESIFEYATKSSGAKAYIALAKEVIERNSNTEG